jgi:hypothetical protein
VQVALVVLDYLLSTCVTAKSLFLALSAILHVLQLALIGFAVMTGSGVQNGIKYMLIQEVKQFLFVCHTRYQFLRQPAIWQERAVEFT